MVDEPISIYHVLLEGRTVGPYDRRTIVGMRIKKTLTSDHVLISTARRAAHGGRSHRSAAGRRIQPEAQRQLLAGPGHLCGQRDRNPGAGPAHSEIQGRGRGAGARATCCASRALARKGLGWKDERVKIVLSDVVHARIKGSRVDLWLRTGQGDSLQRIALELFTPDAAGELVGWLPAATPPPDPSQAEPAARAPLPNGQGPVGCRARDHAGGRADADAARAIAVTARPLRRVVLDGLGLRASATGVRVRR